MIKLPKPDVEYQARKSSGEIETVGNKDEILKVKNVEQLRFCISRKFQIYQTFNFDFPSDVIDYVEKSAMRVFDSEIFNFYTKEIIAQLDQLMDDLLNFSRFVDSSYAFDLVNTLRKDIYCLKSLLDNPIFSYEDEEK